MNRFLFAFAIVAAMVTVSAQTPAAPKKPWGDPDLEGTYTTDNSIGIPFERPVQFGTRTTVTDDEFAQRLKGAADQLALDEMEIPESKVVKDTAPNNAPRHWLERPAVPSRATSLVVDPPDGRIPPMTPEGQKRVAARRGQGGPNRTLAWTTDFSNYDRCISRGVVGSILPAIYGNGTSINQAPGVVVIRNEMIHEARVIPLDGRPHSNGIAMWMGDPRGHWDGNTLVIESTGFTDRTGLAGGAIHSDKLRLTERLTRVDARTLRYEFTVDDPTIYTRPWTVRLNLDQKRGYEIYEYACHEGNYGLRNMLSAARADEKARP